VWHDLFIWNMIAGMQSYVWHDSFTCVAWLVYMRGMPHFGWDAGRYAFICVTWLIYMCGVTPRLYAWHASFRMGCRQVSAHYLYVCRDSFMFVKWLVQMGCRQVCIHMWDMTHLYVWRDSFICVAWLIQMGCKQVCAHYLYMWCDLFICVLWLIHICAMTRSDGSQMGCRQVCIHMRDMTHLHVWRDSFICVAWRIQTGCRQVCAHYLYMCRDSFVFVTWRIHICGMTHSDGMQASFALKITYYVTWFIFIIYCDMTHWY